MSFVFRPLRGWPTSQPVTPPSARKHGTFRSDLSDTYFLLNDELGRVAKPGAVVEIDMEEQTLKRGGGGPTAGAQPLTTPGVVLKYTDKKGRELTLPCDSYHSWRANLRAIALTLGALRAIDRYGVTAEGQQYTGFTALPARSVVTRLTLEQAATFLARHGDDGDQPDTVAAMVLRSADLAKAVYRQAANRLHPNNGGRSGDWATLQDAWDRVREHHGVTT